MSKNKYIYNSVNPVETDVIEEVVETVEEAVKEINEEVDPIEDPIEVVVEEPVTQIIGVVSACNRLRVRKFASLSAPVVCELDVNTEVMICEEKSANGFYKVYTETGIDGYCMKKFVTVR